MAHIFHRDPQTPLPVAVAGDGVYIIDDKGKRYLDASGGAAVSALGHSDPVVRAAIKAQVDRIAFARLDAGGTSLFVMDADGSNERLIHQEPLRAVVNVRWSPDGTRLACPFLQPGANVADPKILIVDVESGEASTVAASLGAGQPVAVAWSGADDVLLYTQPLGQANITGHILVRHELETDRPEILLYIDGVTWSLDVLDEGQAVVGIDSMRANLQEAPLEGGDGAPRWLTLGTSLDRQPTYSPDGRLLAFSTNRAGNLDVWVMQLESGEVRRATDHPGTDWDPSFTPDGKHLIWSSDREGHFEIWMAEPDGRNPRRISDDGFDAENGSVTPDGEWLVYNSAHPEKSGVWKRNLESGEAVQLATGLTGVPEVSPDGRYVLLVRSPGLGRGAVEVVRVADGVTEPLRIECTMDAGTSGSILVGRSRWLPEGSGIAFLCEDEAGRPGIYVQDFAPDQDTLSSRRFLAGMYEDRIAESFGFSPDGKRIVVSLLELRQSVVLADQLPNVSRPRSLR